MTVKQLYRRNVTKKKLAALNDVLNQKADKVKKIKKISKARKIIRKVK